MFPAIRIFIVLALSVLGVLLLLWTKPETKAELKDLPAARVLAYAVKQQDMTPVTSLTGRLQPVRRARLRFELNGQIQARHVEPGQEVIVGERLLTIDQGDYRDRLMEAKAELELERTSLERDRQQLNLLREEKQLQQREVQRLVDLGEKSLASKSAYDAAQAALLKLRSEEARLHSSVASSTSRLELKTARLNLAERNLERTELKAPFPGTVNRVDYELGDYARSGDVAVELVQLDELDLYLEVTGRLMSQLRVGQEIEVRVGGTTVYSKIISLEPDPNSETMTHAIRIRMPGEGLYSGQLAEARIPETTLHDVAVIPASAIVHEEGRAYVYRIDPDLLLQRVEIRLLAKAAGEQAVEGVHSPDRIVARDVAALSEGQQITLENP